MKLDEATIGIDEAAEFGAGEMPPWNFNRWRRLIHTYRVRGPPLYLYLIRFDARVPPFSHDAPRPGYELWLSFGVDVLSAICCGCFNLPESP